MNMKKFLALVLAALTLLSLAAPAFAASSTLSGGSSSGLGGSSSSSSETQQGVIANCSNGVSLCKAASSSASEQPGSTKVNSTPIFFMVTENRLNVPP